MALEFNADKERIISSNLQIRNLNSVQLIVGGVDQKTALFANVAGSGLDSLVRVGINTTNPEYELDVAGQIRTTTSIISDTARINNLDVDTIVNPQLILKAPVLTTYTDPESGQTIFPTSTTPSFRDDSDAIATTNFVYNIATNDVGGRIYVSQQIGDDTFDGRSATKPVRSIKKAAQLASLTEDKETLIVAGGEYLEDNPISLPPKCSVVGDNIRLCICRPQNPGKHMFKAANENYVFGITFRDQIDETGNAIETWKFAYAFDDKQRMYYDKNLGGEFGRNFPVGYQYFGDAKFLVTFSETAAVSGLGVGVTITAESGGTAVITDFTFDEGSNNSGTFIIENITGAIGRGDDLVYDDNGTSRLVVARELESQRIEGEVVRHVTTHNQYSILSIEATDDYPDGLIFELDRYHDYEVGQYLEIENLPSVGLWADFNRFNGRQRISHRIETTDGFSTKVVVYKDTPVDILGISGGSTSVYIPVGSTVTSADNYVIFTLLNSPFKFESATPNEFRFQDAVDLIQRNKDYIAEEALGRVQAEYPLASFDTEKCKRDIKHIINHVSHDLFYGGNAATVEAAERYLVGGQIGFVDEELEETKYGFREARELAIEAMRNTLGVGTYTSIAPYTDSTIIVDPIQAVSHKASDAYRLIQKNKNLIAYEAFYLMTQQFPSWTPPTGTTGQDCIDDILTIIDEISYDLLYGGNSKTYDAANVYVTNTLNGVTYSRTIEDGERDESVFAYTKARDLSIDVIRNTIIGVQGSHGYSQYRDLSITIDPANPTCQTEVSGITTLFGIITQAIGTDAGGVGDLNGISRTEPTVDTTYGLGCANVASAIYTLFDVVIDILDGNLSPARTYPTSYLTDQDGNAITIIDPWDDLPIIEVSPYIFNSSVISFIGGGGCEIDGSKIATPNVPRPGLPEQGKSMVAAAFTIISFGGIGYKVVEDGYCQLVSCFVLFAQDGIFADTGGYASVTNSATNFGIYALRAKGYRREPYSFHRGTISAISFDEIGIATIEVENLQGRPLEHYIVKIGGVTNASKDQFDVIVPDNTKEYFIDSVESVSAGPPYTVQLKMDSLLRIIGNNNRFNDAYNLLNNNAEYIGDEAVGIIQNYASIAVAYNSSSLYDVGDIVSKNGNYYFAIKPVESSPSDVNDTNYFALIVSSADTILFQSDVEKCRRDTKLMVQSWAKDLLNDSNSATWDASKLYIDGTNGGVIHITGYEDATKRVFGVASLLAKLAINNLLRKAGVTLTTQEEQNGNYVARYTAETPYRDLTIVNSDDDGDTDNFTTGDCVDVQSAIASLYGLVVEILDETEVSSGLVRNEGGFVLSVANRDKLLGKDIQFHRPSIVNSSSHTWEYAGSGIDYNALPQNGGQTGSTETSEFEQVSENYGRVYSSGTDELGDFKVGYFAKVENRTGNITFGGTVEISEVSFLRISGGDITVEGFSADNNLGGIFSADEILPTQKAVKDYITNNLGNFINKSYSTNPTPRALVELGDNGRINIDQLPALRPFNVFTVADETARLALEGPLAGDIAIQQDNSLSYILNNDLEFQILEFAPNANYTFSASDIITASPSTAQGEVSQYIHGYIDSIFIADPGSGYVSAPTILIGRQMPANSTVYSGEQVFNNGNVYTITNVVDLSLTTPTAPTHTSGPTNSVTSDNIEYTWIGGLWTTETAYQVGDYVVNSSGNVYQITDIDTVTGVAEPTHTSGSATIDGFTYLFVGSAWSATATYEGGEIVGSNDQAYSLRLSFTTGTTQPSHTSGTTTIDGVDYTYAGIRATATASVTNGRVSTITITNAGTGHISNPDIIFDNTGTSGSGAEATAIARSRLYVEIVNNIKVNAGDQIEDFTSPDPYHVTILEVINTSAQNPNNWVQLTSSNIDATFITSGIINTSRLATSDTDYPANSTTFLRGDQKYASAVQAIRVADLDTPIVLQSAFTRNSYIEEVHITDGGTEYTVGNYTDQNIFGGDGDGAKANFTVSNNAVRTITVTNGGGGYINAPIITFEDAGGALISSIKATAYVESGVVTAIKILDGGENIAAGLQVIITDPLGSGVGATATATIANGVIRRITITDGGIGYTQSFNITTIPSALSSLQGVTGVEADFDAILSQRALYLNTVDFDIRRVSGNTTNDNPFSTVGVARFKKSNINNTRIGQFLFDADGGISIDQGPNSGLDADKLDNQQGIYYLNGVNFINNSITPAKLASDLYSISIDGSAGSAGLLEVKDTRTIDTQPQSSPTGMQLAWKGNITSDGLNDGGTLHSSLTIRRSGATPTDFSGGAINSLAFTDNNNLYMRGSGSNFVSALTLISGGNGYEPGNYTNIPLGGGEGTGLTADIVVNNAGSISSVTLVNSGHGYNKFDTASPTFTVDLPESYFGLDNGRTRYNPWQANQTYTIGTVVYVGNTGGNGVIYEVTTAGTSGTNDLNPPIHTTGSATAPGGTAVFAFIGYTNAIIEATVAQTTGGNWQSWNEIWHTGNDGSNSGMDADTLDGRQLDWILHAENLYQGTLNNRRLPDNLSAKQITDRLTINVPNPSLQTDQRGKIYDFYLEGFVDTGELNNLDTQSGVQNLQLNLYDELGNAKGTIDVKEIVPNNEESDLYWDANISIPDDRLVQYGYNLYRTTAVIADTGTTPPKHPNGTQNNLEFVKKVENPYTIVTAEVSSGTLDDTIIKLGTAVRPATYYNIYDWGTNKDPKWNINKHEFFTDVNGNPVYRLGNDTQLSDGLILFHTSGNTNEYDVRLTASGGTSNDGQGTFNIQANLAQVNGNTIWHGGNVSFNNGFDTSSAWAASTAYGLDQTVTVEGRVYTVTVAGTSGIVAPTATSGDQTLNGVTYSYVGINTYNSTNGNSRAVIRDSNGNFSANRIRADLTGIATGNLALTGGTLTGNITFSQDENGIIWSRNTDGASIKFYNTGNTDTNSRLEFQTSDDANEYFNWTHSKAASPSPVVWQSMSLLPTALNDATLKLNGKFLFSSTAVVASSAFIGTEGTRVTLTPNNAIDTVESKIILGKSSDTVYPGQVRLIIGEATETKFYVGKENDDDDAVTQLFVIDKNGDAVLGGTSTPSSTYKLRVDGTFAATSKSFAIPHPTKENYDLIYGSLEGPEHAVYVRGKVTNGIIELPDYWTALVHEDTITVQLTATGNYNVWVEKVEENKVYTGGGEAFYFVQAMRKDIDNLEVEVDLSKYWSDQIDEIEE